MATCSPANHVFVLTQQLADTVTATHCSVCHCSFKSQLFTLQCSLSNSSALSSRRMRVPKPFRFPTHALQESTTCPYLKHICYHNPSARSSRNHRKHHQKCVKRSSSNAATVVTTLVSISPLVTAGTSMHKWLTASDDISRQHGTVSFV